MRWLGRWFWVLVLPVFSIVGCNEVTTPTTAPFNLTVKSWEPSPDDSVPLEGVKVCQMDTPNCEMTDANGHATLMLPIGDTGYTMDKEGYTRWMHPHTIPADGTGTSSSIPVAQYTADAHNRVGSPYPMRGTGTVVVSTNPPRAGVTFELVAATGMPWYLDEEYNWSPDLTETTSAGGGGFTEVTPGELQVKLGGADQCIPLSSPIGDEPNSVRVPVRDGYVTVVGVKCTLPL